MIFEAAYLGSVPIERIWLGGQIVWEGDRVSTSGTLLLRLLTGAEGETESVVSRLLFVSGSGALTAEPEAQPVAEQNLDIRALLTSGMAADSQEPETVSMEAAFEGGVTAAPYSCGIVLTAGALKLLGWTEGIARAAGTVPTSGRVFLSGTGTAIPAPELPEALFLQGTGWLTGEISTALIEPEQGEGELWGLSAASGTPGTLKVCAVRFLSDAVCVYIARIIEGKACPDPVETGMIPVPTRESTPQYHYTYSGWEVRDSGDNGRYTELLPEQDIDFYYLDSFGVYTCFLPVFPLTVGESYSVLWDGQVYRCTAFFTNFAGMDVIGLGNMAVIGGEDTGEPFLLGVMADNSDAAIFLPSGPGTHRVSVYQGEPTEQSSLEKIIGDTDFHATFTESIRYYTVRFWDGDTLVDTVTVPYGGTANLSVEYKKEGYAFEGWVPSNENIVGNTDCYAQWVEKPSFANMSWSEINEICESGKAADYFVIGEEKEIVSPSGTQYVLRIIGINFDNKADGSGKAGITVAMTGTGRVHVGTSQFYTETGGTRWGTGHSTIEKWFKNTLPTRLPDDLKAVVKTVSKSTTYYPSTVSPTQQLSNEIYFIPSYPELANWSSWGEGLGIYPGLDTKSERILYDYSGNAVDWWSRNNIQGSSYFVKSDGSVSTNNKTSVKTYKAILPCFCI